MENAPFLFSPAISVIPGTVRLINFPHHFLSVIMWPCCIVTVHYHIILARKCQITICKCNNPVFHLCTKWGKLCWRVHTNVRKTVKMKFKSILCEIFYLVTARMSGKISEDQYVWDDTGLMEIRINVFV